MHNIYLKDLEEKFGCNIIIGNRDTILDCFSIDTRNINENDIYVGIKGDKEDGSIYYLDALSNGSIGCIINDNIEIDKDILNNYKDRFIVTCSDTLSLLQKLAAYKRSLYDIPVIAITGSVGKTSTKDIVASVLNKKYDTLKTEGNYNNHIGLPLTILRLKDHEALVVEMGMNNLGEISLLSHIAKPTVAIITNVGTAHIGILGSRENILKAKLEILDGMDRNGILIINNDNDMLHSWFQNNYKNYNIITYGIKNPSKYMADDINMYDNYSTYNVNINHELHEFKINVPGEAFVLNGLCAIAVANYFNVFIEDIKNGIKSFELSKRRMEIENVNGITIINDSYNANVDSMRSAINYLGSLNGKKIAVLGDMLELGDYTEILHREIANIIINNNIDECVLVGEYSKYIFDELINKHYNKKNIHWFNNNMDASNYLKDVIKRGDNILLKASNSMKFNNIYNEIRK